MSALPQLTFEQARARLDYIAMHANQWAGLPCVPDGERMIVHPKYPWARLFNQNKEDDDMPEGVRVVNVWRSKRGYEVCIWREPDGKLLWGTLPMLERAQLWLKTASQVPMWDLDAEITALGKLVEMLTPHQRKTYMLTGCFAETSKRSGVAYLFRRLRPTVAFGPCRNDATVKVLCALCLHPIGYIKNSWAGAMCPTDEVIAHLTLMRGDEREFWKQANQLPAWWPEAGI